VPSLLGLGGGVALDDTIGPCRVDDKVPPGARDVIPPADPADPILACPGRRSKDGVLVSCSTRTPVCLDDEVRSGGLGGGGVSLFFLAVLSLLSESRTVELEDDDVRDSRTAASPSGSALRASTSLLPALLRVTALTGGLVCAGLPCLALGGGIRMGATSPGDCEVIEVGVVSRL
jgi:hypothetical protein